MIKQCLNIFKNEIGEEWQDFEKNHIHEFYNMNDQNFDISSEINSKYLYLILNGKFLKCLSG